MSKANAGVEGEPEADKTDWRVKRSYGTQKLSDSFATHLRNEGFKDITEARNFAKASLSEDAVAGIVAFLSKQEPEFKGR